MEAQVKKIAVVTVAIALVFSSSLLYAEGGRGFRTKGFKHREQGDKEGKIEHLIEELNLTSEQQELLKTQRQKNREKAKELKKQLHSKRSELRKELEKQNIDKEKIYAVIAEIEALMGDELEQRVERILAMRQILTPEQFTKLQEKKDKKYEKHEGRFEKKDCRHLRQ